MGRSIDLYSYDATNLIDAVLDYCKTDNQGLVKKILSEFGTFMEDRYIILHQELWEGCNCYFNLSHVLDRVFGVEDSFGEVFCTFGSKYNVGKKDLVRAIEVDEAMENLFGEDWEEKYPEQEDGDC